jgi:ABC-type lipoprotein release transport system permease subunit
LVFGAELRRYWRSWLILVILIAVVGGLVLAAAAAGRRTASAFPRFVAAHGYDVYIYNTTPVPKLSTLPGVASVTPVRIPASGQPTCACTHVINSTDFYINEVPQTGLDRLVKLVAGRMPTQSSTDDVLASFTLQQDYGVHVGTVIHAPFYASSQLPALTSGANEAPSGPTVALHVVGIEAAESEFPSGQGPEYELFTTQAFAHAFNPHIVLAQVYLVRLDQGAADLPRFTNPVSALHLVYISDQDAAADAVAASIHPQAVGWWVLAALGTLAGLVVVGQALGRQSVVESQEYPSLTALGLPRHQLVVLGTARNLLVAFAGAVGTVVVAFVLSRLTPVGEARLAEPSPGFAFDPLVLLLGALAIVVVVLALGAWPAVRASRVDIADDRAPDHRPSPIVARLAALGAPPSAVIGVRHALKRGRGAASVPVGTALFGTALAITALCATAVFGASLSHLTATPALYGNDYQLTFSNQGGADNPTSEVADLKRDRSITAIMEVTRADVSINGTNVPAVTGRAIRGPLLLSTVSGRLPTGNGEIVLGTTTMHQVGAHVGSVVHATLQVPTGGTRTATFHVVGTASFPSEAGLGGLGTGAAFTSAGYLNALCSPGPTQSRCKNIYDANNTVAVLARVTPGPRGRADIARYTSKGTATRAITPISLINFGEAVNFPLIVGFMLALFGAATLIHLLVVSVARRRREIGLLKSLGFVNGQIGAAVCWQATTIALVGVVIGVPLGIVVGRAVWQTFATNLGTVPVATVKVWLIVALGAGVLVIANLLAIAPALVARSKNAGELLRTQ